ncbi:MAG: alpha/beta hydrolase [Peptostreptococcaceae bacterium]
MKNVVWFWKGYYMKSHLFSKLKRKMININRTIIYSYIKDFSIKGEIIRYGENNEQYYKIYKQDNNKDESKSIIFFIHGGGWWHGNPSLYSGVGKYFYKKGYTTVLPGYRLVPRHRYPTQIEDVFTVLSHYIKHNKDVKSIIVCGYSAGGELASHIVFDHERQEKYNIDHNILKGFISISGVLDFLKCTSTYSKILIKNYVYKGRIDKANPINLLNKEVDIPIMCIHGDYDSLISVNTSISFIDKVQNLDENTILKIIKKAEHEDTIEMVRGEGNKYSNYIMNFIEEIDKLKEIDI